ncbi:MAG: radical SAM protein [bacterium]|nr:MAG: radical SAM protein [bacterium]
MRLADSHSHLNHPDFRDDVDKIAASLKEKGFLALNVAYDLESAQTAIELAEKYDHMRASAGIHPHDAGKVTHENLIRLAELASHDKVAAVGETGLDYYRNRSPKEDQKKVLRQHLKIAREVKKPVIIHCREGFGDIAPILKEDAETGGVLHCFSEGPKEAVAGLELGFHISFSGNLTYRNAQKIREAARIVPSEFLLMETDCPYLAPQPMRGKRNEPSYIVETARALADVRNVSLEDIARVTYVNYQKLFLGGKPAKGEIVYKIRDSIYINLTNSCTNMCGFCDRLDNPVVQGHYLRLEHEPTAAEILGAIGDKKPEEVVFCGYGEPTLRLDVLKEVASELKKRGLKKIRLNTNGHGNIIHGRDIVPELLGLIDTVSVSLNAPDAETYDRLCRPAVGGNAFVAVCDFIRRCRELLPDVVATCVDLPESLDVESVKKFAEENLKVKFRLRAYNITG